MSYLKKMYTDQEKSEIILNIDFDKVFDTIIEILEEISKVKTKSKITGVISGFTPTKLFPPQNSVKYTFSIFKNNDSATKLIMNFDCFDGIIGLNSVSRFEEKFLDELNNKF